MSNVPDVWYDFENDLMRLFKLPLHTRKFRITVEAGADAIIECEYYPNIDKDDFTAVELKYELTVKEKT